MADMIGIDGVDHVGTEAGTKVGAKLYGPGSKGIDVNGIHYNGDKDYQWHQDNPGAPNTAHAFWLSTHGGGDTGPLAGKVAAAQAATR
jgi:hypothetical protein